MRTTWTRPCLKTLPIEKQKLDYIKILYIDTSFSGANINSGSFGSQEAEWQSRKMHSSEEPELWSPGSPGLICFLAQLLLSLWTWGSQVTKSYWASISHWSAGLKEDHREKKSSLGSSLCGDQSFFFLFKKSSPEWSRTLLCRQNRLVSNSELCLSSQMLGGG